MSALEGLRRRWETEVGKGVQREEERAEGSREVEREERSEEKEG